MQKSHTRKTVTFALILILLIITLFTVFPTLKVSAAVSITQLSPTQGPVGTIVTVTGQISTANGTYKVFFDEVEVAGGNATALAVSTTFIVGNYTFGSYPVKLHDGTTKENSTANFKVLTKYIVKAVTLPAPQQFQEGASITILAIVTGGNITTLANMTVKDPSNATHNAFNITISAGTDGYGEANRTYPTDFDTNSHTFYVGTYSLELKKANGTLATGTFTIGLTNAAQYHRFETVNVKALNYTANDVLTVTMKFGDRTVFQSTPRNATMPEGIITANWTIPANATLGTYRVSVTSTGTQKTVAENQTFTIVSKSFKVEVKTVNLDNEPAGGIGVEANNTVTATVTSNTTDEEGLTSFSLEASNYTFAAFLNNSQVGATAEISLASDRTGAQAIIINCSLVNIKIATRDTEANTLPFVTININFTYVTRTNTTTSRTLYAETNLTGIAVLRNLFINKKYTINALRYDQTFYTAAINLTSTTWVNITCPTLELMITVFDRSNEPLKDAVVEVFDWGIGLSGLARTGNTGISGEVAFNLTFGKYIVRVHKNDYLLNETSILLISQSTSFAVYCKLYNLTLNINVLDYLGQGIPNANVTLEREGIITASLNTGGSGTASFTRVVGGNYRILVYISGKPYEIMALNLEQPETVTLKVEELVSIAGFITETSTFITAIFILLVFIVFLLVFIYRRFKSRQKKEE